MTSIATVSGTKTIRTILYMDVMASVWMNLKFAQMPKHVSVYVIALLNENRTKGKQIDKNNNFYTSVSSHKNTFEDKYICKWKNYIQRVLQPEISVHIWILKQRERAGIKLIVWYSTVAGRLVNTQYR